MKQEIKILNQIKLQLVTTLFKAEELDLKSDYDSVWKIREDLVKLLGQINERQKELYELLNKEQEALNCLAL